MRGVASPAVDGSSYFVLRGSVSDADEREADALKNNSASVDRYNAVIPVA